MSRWGGETILRIRHWVLGVDVLGAAMFWADDRSQVGRLRLVEAAVRDELASVVPVVISPDERFAYVPAEEKRAISVFRREEIPRSVLGK